MMTAITAAERGAYDYLAKPFDLSVLVQTVTRALEQQARPAARPPAQGQEQLPIVGRSPAMQEIYRVIARLTQTDLTALIIGESGTGKELVARALHDYGKRRKGTFVAVNMAAIPRELIESELFGHEKGAFTGAGARLAGRFEQAEGGTLFLDEIGDMPLEAQTRLLRVLQQGEYTSVGGTAAIKANVRIIAATHRDLRKLIAHGSFREDLFFRLNVVPLRLPALRERLEDMPDLIQHFLARATAEGLPRKAMAPEAVERLKAYRWPGNVRELENLIKRLAVMEVEDTITAATVERELAASPPLAEQPAARAASAATLGEFLENHLAQYFAGFGGGLPPEGLYERILAEVEPPLLRASLTATHGNQLRAADLLGINRNTLRTKLKERNIRSIRGLGSA
jgi:two-component system nitrogen regulation response regulator GlnG